MNNRMPNPERFPLWQRIRPSLSRWRAGLLTSFALLLVLLLIVAWIGLIRQPRPATVGATSTRPLPIPQIEPPRRESSLVYDPLRHVVLLFGGTLLTPGGAQTNETWIWNGQAWRLAHPTVSPPALQGTLVYDAASQQVLLFLTQVLSGGNVANEMWTWNGTTWHQLQPSPMPQILGASIAYDAGRGQVVLFGGEAPDANGQNTTPTSATWTWNGRTWQEQHPVTSPSPRTAAALAYDNSRRQLILYGGITQAGLSSETWTWDGTTWQEAQGNSPFAPRQNVLLTYDSAAQQMLLFGGLNAAGTQPAPNDTWAWQNNTWTRVSATGAPTGLYESAVYDGATQTVTVYTTQGSIDKLTQSGTPTSQTWIWNGTTWKQI